MLWVFAALAVIELLVVHLFVSLKWPSAAWALTIVTGLSVLWLVRWITSFKRLPHSIDGNLLRLHFGSLKTLYIRLDQIAEVRSTWESGAHGARRAINLVPVAHPNRMLALDPPLPGKRGPKCQIFLRVDDPAAFDRALGAHGVIIV